VIAVTARQCPVEEQRSLSQRLEGGAPLRQTGFAPGQEDPLAILGGKVGEALPAAAAEERRHRLGIPDGQQLLKLLALGLTGVQPDGSEQGVRHPNLTRAENAVGGRTEGVTDRLEGDALA
jgi:hypothetical protein